MLWKIVQTLFGEVLILPAEAPIAERDVEAGAAVETLSHAATLKATQRRSEFLRSRWLFRTASGIAQDPRKTAEGDILWPEGFCGSLSHKRGHVAFSLTSCDNLKTLGLDLENLQVNPGIEPKVLSDVEVRLLAQHLPANLRVGATFAAKEAIFKAVFPLGRQMFWFHEAAIVAVQKTMTGFLMQAELLKDVGYAVHQKLQIELIALRIHAGTVQIERELAPASKYEDKDFYWLAVCGIAV